MTAPDCSNGVKDEQKSTVDPTSTTNDDPDRELPPAMRESMAVLRRLQSEHDKLYDEYNVKRRELEEQYEALYKPLYEARKVELERGNISSFWLTALENCKVVSENITDRDKGALEFLKHIEYHTVTKKEADEKKSEYPAGSIILSFCFSPNPFFTNEVLKKTYVMDQDDDEELKKTIGSKIEWKPGKNLTVKMLKRKNRHRGDKSSRVITKMEPCDSFFNFFSPPDTSGDKAEMSPEEVEALDTLIAADFEVGETICSEIVSRAVLWYADEVDDSDEDDEDDDDVEEDEDDGDTNANG